MSATTTIECSPSSEEQEKWGADLAAIGAESLLNVDTDGSNARLRFSGGEDVRAAIDAFVEAESTCCAFFEFQVDEAGGEIAVSIKAPADAMWATRALVAAFVSGWLRR